MNGPSTMDTSPWSCRTVVAVSAPCSCSPFKIRPACECSVHQVPIFSEMAARSASERWVVSSLLTNISRYFMSDPSCRTGCIHTTNGEQGNPTRRCAGDGRSEFRADLLEDHHGVGGGGGLQAQPLHYRVGGVHVGTPVQVQRAGELLEVHDIGQVGLGDPEQAERAARGRVAARLE